jgi:soluble lytic murein transglycosylase-like protein
MNKTFLIIAALGIGLAMLTRKLWIIPAKGILFAPFFSAAEYQYALPPRLLARVAKQESNFDPGAYNSGSGASGMMQIIPKWHPGVNVTDLDPRDDIIYAAKYLRENHDRFGSWSKALAAYNWGPGNLSNAISRYPTDWLEHAPQETQNYVIDITSDIGIA